MDTTYFEVTDVVGRRRSSNKITLAVHTPLWPRGWRQNGCMSDNFCTATSTFLCLLQTTERWWSLSGKFKEFFLHVASSTGMADMVITGDFNFPCVDWSTGSATVADNLTESFCEILDDDFLTQTNHYVTRFKNTGSAVSSGNILDLVLTNSDALIVHISVYPHSFDSDHLPVCFSIKSKFKRPNNNTTRTLLL